MIRILLGNFLILHVTTIFQLFVHTQVLAKPDFFFLIRKTDESEIKVQNIILHANILIIPKKAREHT